MSEDNFDSQFDDEELTEETPEEDFEDDFEEESQDFEEEESGQDFDDQFGDDNDSGDDNDYDKPVEEGDIVEIEVEDLGSKGDGIARVEGFVIFVPGGEVGETYDVEVTSVGRKFAFAEIAE